MNAAAAPEVPGLRFVRLIESGGYAAVYLYEKEQPRMEVAVKVLNTETLSADTSKFTDEANAMARSQHPYIAQVLEADVTSDGRPYIVMKYYSGKSYAVRAKAARFDVSECLRAGIHIACAVETAHRKGIFHRDIKPANILTDEYGSPALTDFGIAAVASDQTSDEEHEGMSLPWAPREIVYGTSRADARSDVYSLGATLWTLLVGRSPFQIPGSDNSAIALMRRIDVADPPSTGRGDVPNSLERLLASCIAKSPDDRPASALQLARSLQSIEQELRLPVTPLTLAGQETASRSEQDASPDATRIRSPQTVIAQPLAQDPPVRTPAPTEQPTPNVQAAQPRERERVFPSAVVPDATVQRPKTVSPDGVQPAPAPEAPRPAHPPQRWYLIAGSVLVIILGAGTAAALSSGGSKSGSGSRTKSTATPQNPVSDHAPGPPHIQAGPAPGNKVRFTWTYANPNDRDTYSLEVGPRGKLRNDTSRKPRYSVAKPRHGGVCIKVLVVRDDGSYATNNTREKCWHP